MIGNSLRPTSRAKACLACSLALAAGQDALAAEAELPPAPRTELFAWPDVPPWMPAESIVPGEVDVRLAQFQLPPPGPAASSSSPGGQAPAGPLPGEQPIFRYADRPVISRLKYQFSWGSESDITYRRNLDLDDRLKDRSLIAMPQINGAVLYRPTDNVEMMLEAILEREVALKEEVVVTLPSGESQFAPRHFNSLAIDQAWVSFRNVGPIDLTLGRRNYEDERHWLYDTSLDTILARVRKGALLTELSYSRKDRWDGDLLAPVQKTRIDTHMAHMVYRGIEDVRLAGYAVSREDRAGQKGKPLIFGLRAFGNPSDRFNYWSELALLRGKDETKTNFKGHAIDIGGTYRFPELPYAPNITFGYAYGSGDGNPNDGRNTEFRQTGLHSNEARLGGIPKLKYYGEALDPDLSNLQIVTLGFGFRPAPTVSVDVVYHRYRTNEIATQLRNSALTAEMNQSDSPPSKRVGEALDLVVGMRNLFGVRRLGLDIRAGFFFPRAAFRNEVVSTDPVTGDAVSRFRKADKSISFIAKFWF
jgi:alginate production protein